MQRLSGPNKIKTKKLFYTIEFLFVLAHATYMCVFVLNILKIFDGYVSKGPLTLLIITIGFIFEFVFELLTGQFADRHGRPLAVLLAGLMYFLCSILLFFPSFYSFNFTLNIIFVIAGQLTLMLGASLFSGSIEAWLVDSLNHENKKSKSDDLSHVFANTSWVTNMGWLVGGYIALFLYEYNSSSPWLFMSTTAILVALLTKLYMSEPYLNEKEFKEKKNISFKQFFTNLIRYILNNKNIIYLTIGFLGTYSAWNAVSYFWISMYEDFLILDFNNDVPFGIRVSQVWLYFSLARLVGSWLSKYCAKRNIFGQFSLLFSTSLSLLPLLIPWLALSFSPESTTLSLIFLICIVFSKVGNELEKPIRSTLLNKEIEDGYYRSTIISSSIFFGAFFSIGLFLFFALTDQNNQATHRWHLHFITAIALICSLISIPAYLIYSPKKKNP